MPSDEELRKVAEDMRALARSLARDFWHATDAATRSGRPPVDAVRQSLREMADEARRSAHQYRGHHHGYRSGRRGRWYGPPPGGWWSPPGPPPAGSGPGPGTPAPPPGAPDWGRPSRRPDHRARKRCRGGLPPVRRRWDATTVAGVLAVLFGGAWLLAAVGAVHVPAEAVVAVGLMLLGAAVVVTARTDWSLSRRSWPLWLGGLLLVVLAATSATFGVEGSLRHLNIGTQTLTASDGVPVYGGLGDFTVDAAKMQPGQRLTVESVAGTTVINTPTNAYLSVNARLVAGQICVAGRDQADGIGAQWQQIVGPPNASNPHPIFIDVHQVAGRIQIGGPGCSR